MTAKNDVVDILSCFTITSTAVLVIDTTVENDRSLVSSTKFKLKLSKADKRCFSNLEMTLGAITAKRIEIS